MDEIVSCACGCGATFPARAPGQTRPRRFLNATHRCRVHRAEVRAGKVALPLRRPPEPDFGARVMPQNLSRPMQVGIADPPYPGRASLYVEDEEVRPDDLVADLVARFPDGWALATDAIALREVLGACPAGVLIGSWHHGHRPYNERPRGWEAVIVCGGRRQPGWRVPDTLTERPPHGWDRPGAKPAAWWWWTWALLGVDPSAGDRFEDLFPGSGGGAHAWTDYRPDQLFGGVSRRRNVASAEPVQPS